MRTCFPSLLVFVYLLAQPSVFGQSNYGVITGTVADPQHLPITGAAVQITAASTGAVRRVLTNQEGFCFCALTG